MGDDKKEFELIVRIKELCKGRGISLSRLERECGFSNSYLTNLRAGKMPADRLQKVADYFGVSTKFLLTGEEDEEYYSPEAKAIAQEIHDDPELRALFHLAKTVSPEQLRFIENLLRFMTTSESDN